MASGSRTKFVVAACSGAVCAAAALLACRTDFQDEAAFQGYDASAIANADGGGARADAAQTVDVGSDALSDGTQAVVVSFDDGGTDDTGAPIQNCSLTQNGSSCGTDASACCSGICNEARLCTGNQCVAVGNACTNILSIGLAAGYVTAKDNCCVNTFCSPASGKADQGTCAQCIQSGATAPVRTVIIPVTGNVPVVYVNACCSGGAPNASGMCP
jgi:hypothetical protein